MTVEYIEGTLKICNLKLKNNDELEAFRGKVEGLVRILHPDLRFDSDVEFEVTHRAGSFENEEAPDYPIILFLPDVECNKNREIPTEFRVKRFDPGLLGGWMFPPAPIFRYPHEDLCATQDREKLVTIEPLVLEVRPFPLYSEKLFPADGMGDLMRAIRTLVELREVDLDAGLYNRHFLYCFYLTKQGEMVAEIARVLLSPQGK